MNYDHKKLKEYQNNTKINICSASSIVFEMIHDFACPLQHILTFVYFNRIPSKGNIKHESNYHKQMYTPVFANINLKELAKWKARKKKAEPVEDQDYVPPWFNYHKIYQYESPYFEHQKRKDYFQKTMRALFDQHCPLLVRNSNWQQNVHQGISGTHYSARFKVGFISD